ncbi:MAG: exodeoxyribonuclease VII small subunit [Anaerosomatales bacterium]|nr:exodeoxyribonuclease VII small subunit [Anaerosomatales bacterium]
MADERYTFEQARVRLDEIASQVRKKDTSLEKSLELLEEGVRLAGICTELVDHTDFSETRAVPPVEDEATGEGEDGEAGIPAADAEPAGPAGDHAASMGTGEDASTEADAGADVDEPTEA